MNNFHVLSMNESVAQTLHYESRVVTRDYPNSQTTSYYMRLRQGTVKDDSRFEWTTGNILGATASLIICLSIVMIFVVCLLQTIKKKLRNYRNGSQTARDGLSPNLHTITSNTGEVSFINIAGNLVIIPSTEEPPPYEQALSSPRLTRLSKTNLLGLNTKPSDNCLPTYEDALKSVVPHGIPVLSADSPPILSPATPATPNSELPITKSHSTIGLTNFALDINTSDDSNPNKVFEPNHDTPLPNHRQRMDYSARRSISAIPPLVTTANGWGDRINLLSKSAIRHIKQNLSIKKYVPNTSGQLSVISMTRGDLHRPVSQPLSTLATTGLNSRLNSYLTEGSVVVQGTIRPLDSLRNRVTHAPTSIVSSAQNIPNFFIFPNVVSQETTSHQIRERDTPLTNSLHDETVNKIRGGNMNRNSNLTYVTSPIETNFSINRQASHPTTIGDETNSNNSLQPSTTTTLVSDANDARSHIHKVIDENIDEIQC